MSTKTNMQVTRQLFDEVFSNGGLEKIGQFLDPNVQFHDVALDTKLKGIEGFKKAEQQYQTAFPDKKASIDQIIATDDEVVVLWTCKGTHKGKLENFPPSNKRFEISGIAVYRFSNGKITEVWQSWDRLGLLEQIGEIETSKVLHA